MNADESEKLREALAAGSVLSRLADFGKLYLFNAVSSTNDMARALVGLGEQAIVIARTQTSGRGRFQRAWHSAPGGLYFSVLLFPKELASASRSLITLTFGLACARTIERIAGIRPEIAWPNDLLVGAQKLAGILAETRGPAVIIGCGMNVNQIGFPDGLEDAASIRLLTGREYDPDTLLRTVVTEFHAEYENLAAGRAESVLSRVREYMTMLGRRIRAETAVLGPIGSRSIEGLARDIDDSGRLVVETVTGKILALNSGTVRRIR